MTRVQLQLQVLSSLRYLLFRVAVEASVSPAAAVTASNSASDALALQRDYQRRTHVTSLSWLFCVATPETFS